MNKLYFINKDNITEEQFIKYIYDYYMNDDSVYEDFELYHDFTDIVIDYVDKFTDSDIAYYNGEGFNDLYSRDFAFYYMYNERYDEFNKYLSNFVDNELFYWLNGERIVINDGILEIDVYDCNDRILIVLDDPAILSKYGLIKTIK